MNKYMLIINKYINKINTYKINKQIKQLNLNLKFISPDIKSIRFNYIIDICLSLVLMGEGGLKVSTFFKELNSKPKLGIYKGLHLLGHYLAL